MPIAMSMFDGMDDAPPLPVPSKSVLLCDVPFLESLEADLPFRSANADVPDDLLACAPIHGWDSPPESPVHHPQVEMLDGVDPMLNSKLTGVFDSPSSSPLYDWTPPASPQPSAACDDAMLCDFPDLDAFGISGVPTALSLEGSTPEPVKPVAQPSKSLKRKISSSSVDERERKRIRDKQEASRIARTQACEQAVKALANNKDEDPESKRHTHNVLERKRRNDLKNSYQLLRERVPSLEDDDRAPTGKILLHAVEYINVLKKDEALLEQQISHARAENDRLRRQAGLVPVSAF